MRGNNKIYYTLFGLLGIWLSLFPFSSLASDLTTPNSNLYPFKSVIRVQEDFAGGGTVSGTIGSLGMGSAGGTTSIIASEANRPGIVRRDTSAVINTITTLVLYPGSSALMTSSLPHSITWVERLNTNDANTELRIGLAASTGAAPPNDGEYFEKLAADTNYFCVTRAASVETRTDSTIAVNTSFNTFVVTRGVGVVTFQINGVAVCSHTTNLTAVLANPFTQIQNTAAASKTHDHDYFQLVLTGIVR